MTTPQPLTVVATLTAKPGSEAAVRAALVTLAAATRAEEGNLSYDLHESTATPGAFVFIERWRSDDDLQAHGQTAHIKTAFSTIGEHLASPPVIHPLQPVDVA